MKEFDFPFGLVPAERILKHTDNLSKTIQATTMPAVEARGLSKLCIQVFEKMRTEDCFGNYQSQPNVCWMLKILLYHDPTKGRCSMKMVLERHIIPVLQRIIRQFYFQCLDDAIMTINNCFNQEDFIMYSKLEELIIKAATKQTSYTQELQEVIKFYGANFDASDLET